uniref:hypothetical protein n=1 Tax=Streptomyces sp. NBC_01562 TaxID=2975879 RepID=UPI002F9121F4
MLPLEAIELDAFRRRHEHDTFWCGPLLGGCGVQLATRLYTDRVCPGRTAQATQAGSAFAHGAAHADDLVAGCRCHLS